MLLYSTLLILLVLFLFCFRSGSRPADHGYSMCADIYGVVQLRVTSAASAAGTMCCQVNKWHLSFVIKDC